MPALRLKTKLVISITLMVVVIVASLAAFYIHEVVRQRVQETNEDAKAIAEMTQAAATGALEVDLSDTPIDLNDPRQVNKKLQQLLETDSAVNSLLESWIGTVNFISDIAITDTDGKVLSHSDPSLIGKTIERREDFADLVNAGVWKQLKLIVGPYRAY